ncbi:hypothetical protein PENARI_c012G12566 [Penicillium arizonense]|uniref:Uncharacterized protein n=1 Tax=Penicillium arizonense TaxID=1835702 RepID=A0A1F5LF27_PENAI|nr:hypothetical protein PENARI_c012G12566 [Penicillium arizonense]OGE51823.1 hypothetical protein PENARI_c012G12566 [Penicillium arizonense]
MWGRSGPVAGEGGEGGLAGKGGNPKHNRNLTILVFHRRHTNDSTTTATITMGE